MAKAVIESAVVVALDHQSGLEQQLALGLAASQGFQQSVPAGRCEADSEMLHRVITKTAMLEIAAGLGGLWMLGELALEPQRRRLQLGGEFRLAGAGGPLSGLARYLDSRDRGKLFHRRDEVEPFVFHQEADRVAAGAAAEAVVELLVGVDAEGGAFLVVEGAERGVVLARFAQVHAGIDHVDDIDALEQVIDELLRNSS